MAARKPPRLHLDSNQGPGAFSLSDVRPSCFQKLGCMAALVEDMTPGVCATCHYMLHWIAVSAPTTRGDCIQTVQGHRADTCLLCLCSFWAVYSLKKRFAEQFICPNHIPRSRPELRLLFLPLSFTACDAQSHSHAFLCPSTRKTGCAELLLAGRAFRRRSREGPAHDHNL